MRKVKARKSRGVAMLLVLISLMTASVLSVAYVASRDNSALIGENITSSAAARWGADAGLDIGLSVLQTQADWRSASSSGMLVDDHAIGGSNVDIGIVDLETGAPPTSATEYVRITSTALSNGVEQSSSAIAYVPSPLYRSADLDLSEFSIFATNQITLSNEAVVARWPMTPLSTLGTPVPVATQSLAAGSISLGNVSAIVDGQVYAAPGASGALVTSASGNAPEVISLGDAIPMPAPPRTAVTDPADLSVVEKLLHLTLNVVGGLGLINTDTRVADANLNSNAVRTIRGPITFTSNDDLELQNAKILIEGAVKMVIFDDLILQNASIELRPGARLLLYVGDALSMQDSYIGDQRANSLRDNTGRASPMNLDRLKIFRVPQYTSGANWTMSANSVMKANVYARGARFEIKDQSALYGRVAAKEVRMSEHAALFYDPSLNRSAGYTSPDSELYDSNGLLKPSVKTLTSLSTSDLQALANATGIVVKPATDEVTVVQPAGYTADAPDMGVPTQPTPRPVKITYQRISYGVDMRAWEHR